MISDLRLIEAAKKLGRKIGCTAFWTGNTHNLTRADGPCLRDNFVILSPEADVTRCRLYEAGNYVMVDFHAGKGFNDKKIACVLKGPKKGSFGFDILMEKGFVTYVCTFGSPSDPHSVGELIETTLASLLPEDRP